MSSQLDVEEPQEKNSSCILEYMIVTAGSYKLDRHDCSLVRRILWIMVISVDVPMDSRLIRSGSGAEFHFNAVNK